MTLVPAGRLVVPCLWPLFSLPTSRADRYFSEVVDTGGWQWGICTVGCRCDIEGYLGLPFMYHILLTISKQSISSQRSRAGRRPPQQRHSSGSLSSPFATTGDEANGWCGWTNRELVFPASPDRAGSLSEPFEYSDQRQAAKHRMATVFSGIKGNVTKQWTHLRMYEFIEVCNTGRSGASDRIRDLGV